ncbi:MAG TPA: family 20 glycosylhydrolase [Terracidiphilus sp.]|nr:family 20 glycosylhydrolase [Terracidiphilus sp.]
MRLRFCASSLAFLSSALVATAQVPAPACADLHIVPAVRECRAVEATSLGEANLDLPIRQESRDKSLGDTQFAVEDLQQYLSARGINTKAERSVGVSFAPASVQKEVLARHGITFDASMHDEGYAIAPDGRGGVVVIAETPAGFFYGAQTVKQLIRSSGKETVLLVPTIRDWPAMAHRGLSDDWSRGPLPNMDFVKREIRTLAAYKYNIFSPYFEHTFAYSNTPVAAFPGGAMTPDEAREMVEYAAKYHITIIPEQEAFGHLHHVLKFEQYSSVGETPHGHVLAPGDPGTLPMIAGWFGELAKVFPGPYAHIGADETAELGLGRTRAEVKQQGLGKVYLGFLSSIHDTLQPNHKQLLFWGDIAVNSPELVGTLPKDMIAVPWEYDAKPDFTSQIEPFTKAGLETWVAPGVNNWSRLYPNNNEALGNIRAFVRDGQKLGSTGMLNTVWNDDGEGLFDQNWFGVLFGAAAAWQPGESQEASFTDSYGLAFHADATGKISQAQSEVMAVHALLKSVGLGDAQDAYFWIDPFSPEGRQVAAKLRPILKDLRLHAERAITLLAEARDAARSEHRELANPEPLDALELGARRIDFVGLKFQNADEIVALYNQALSLAADKSRWDEVDNLLETIGSNNGRIQDIRDGYALLGGLYRQAWLRVNRPYWLENNLARYDKSAELWIDRGDKWSLVEQQWFEKHTLPSAAEAGLPAAAQ